MMLAEFLENVLFAATYVWQGDSAGTEFRLVMAAHLTARLALVLRYGDVFARLFEVVAGRAVSNRALRWGVDGV